MDAVMELIRENDSYLLYAILAAQVLIVFVGYFVLITSCCNERKR